MYFGQALHIHFWHISEFCKLRRRMQVQKKMERKRYGRKHIFSLLSFQKMHYTISLDHWACVIGTNRCFSIRFYERSVIFSLQLQLHCMSSLSRLCFVSSICWLFLFLSLFLENKLVIRRLLLWDVPNALSQSKRNVFSTSFSSFEFILSISSSTCSIVCH